MLEKPMLATTGGGRCITGASGRVSGSAHMVTFTHWVLPQLAGYLLRVGASWLAGLQTPGIVPFLPLEWRQWDHNLASINFGNVEI